jgi:predicted Zn-dependent protease
LSPSYAGPFPPVGSFQEQLDSTVRHEIGHALGLAHVDDQTQLMNDVAVEGVYDYANGDRQGMWLLASQQCIPV